MHHLHWKEEDMHSPHVANCRQWSPEEGMEGEDNRVTHALRSRERDDLEEEF